MVLLTSGLKVQSSLLLIVAVPFDRVVNDPGSNADPAAGHENKAKCGEVNSFHQYYMTHTTPISEVDPKVRVTTVVRGNKGFSILAPCGTANNGEDEKSVQHGCSVCEIIDLLTRYQDFWGCNLLARDKDVHYIGQGEKALPFALHKIAGGVQRKGQIQMCTRNHIIWDGE